MTSTPSKKPTGSDNSKIVEHQNITNDEDYIPISKFYNGRSIFITGGKRFSCFRIYESQFFQLI